MIIKNSRDIFELLDHCAEIPFGDIPYVIMYVNLLGDYEYKLCKKGEITDIKHLKNELEKSSTMCAPVILVSDYTTTKEGKQWLKHYRTKRGNV